MATERERNASYEAGVMRGAKEMNDQVEILPMLVT